MASSTASALGVNGGICKFDITKIGLHVQNENTRKYQVSFGQVLVLMLVKIICSTAYLSKKFGQIQ